MTSDWIVMLVVALLLPFVLMIIGFLMAKWPPKRINHFCGYRTSRSMKSQAAWDFANVLSGKVLCLLGAVLLVFNTVVMLFVKGASASTVYTLGMVLCGISLAGLLAVPVWVERQLKKRFDDEMKEKHEE